MNPRQFSTVPLAAAPAPPHAAPTPSAQHEPLRLQRKAGACSCGGNCPRCSGNLDSEDGRIQRQLRIGASDDALEREADRVAAAVTASGNNGRVSPAAQSIQRLPAGGADAAGSAAPASVQQTLGRSGSALDNGVREQMEQRFGQDFSNVRVHADSAAARSAEAIDAQAYTAGANIVFAAGQYAPQSAAGQHLIAHELTHIVQQAGGAAQRVFCVGESLKARALELKLAAPQKLKVLANGTAKTTISAALAAPTLSSPITPAPSSAASAAAFSREREPITTL